VYLAYVPGFLFWGLDGYFLWQERLYRALYDSVREKAEAQVDFSMDTGPFKSTTSWLSAVISRTLLAFHGGLMLAVVIVMVLLVYPQ